MCSAAALAWLAGCKSQPKQVEGYQAPTAPTQEPPAGDPAMDMTAHADRIEAAMARSQAEAEARAQAEAAAIEWIEPTAPPAAPAVKPGPAEAAVVEADPEPKPEAETDVESLAADEEPTLVETTPEAPATPAAPATMTRGELIDALLTEISASGDPALERALDASLVTLGQAGREIDPEVYASLNGAQREQVARFQSLIQLFRHQLTTGTGEVTRRDAEEAIAEMFSAMPLEIRTAALCRKVEGYGVYEPFEGHTFLAGRENKMIVYVELDNFEAKATDAEHFEVRLEQELALFTDWDGQKVWQTQPREITDRSRNRRRDFFVVQMVTLPARLGVGKYVLKIDVTDKHGGSIDAIPIEISLVADPSLVQRDDDRRELIRRLLEEEEDRPLRDK